MKRFQEKNWKNLSIKEKFFSWRKKILIKKHLKKFFWVFVFLVFFWFLFFIFFSNYFSVAKIDFARKNFSFNPENISKDLEKNFWKNIFFINTFSLENALEKKYPQFKEISVKKIFPETLYFEVSSYQDVFKIHTFFTKKNENTWVKEKFLQEFLISQSWQLKILPEKFWSATWTWSVKTQFQIIFIKEDLWKKMEIWENFIKWEILAKIQKINSFLEKNEKLKVENIFYWPNWKELHFNTDKWSFWFTLSKDIDIQLQKIADFKEFKNLQNFEKKEFEYLDLRITDKIIYK